MENKNKRRKKFIGTSVQNKTLMMVFAAAVIPAAIVGVCLYYFIFNLLAWQLGIPEAIAYNLVPVAKKINMVIMVVLPIALVSIWFMALELSHRIAGPIYRLEKELDKLLAGEKVSQIRLRKNDELKPLADKINRLVNKQ
ncbi:MAG: hypothetical protein ABH843_07475 [Candidatus Omnitrophota bacterium]